MKQSTIDEALAAIVALPPKERAAAIADIRARQLLEATTKVIRLAPGDLGKLADRLPKSVKGMTEDDYGSAKSAVIRNDHSTRMKAEQAADLTRAMSKHKGKF